MTNMMLKTWFYDKIQDEAFLKNKTIVWDGQFEYNENCEEIKVYTIKVNSIIRETEKAIYVDCCYWYHGRTVNFTEYTGYKVWIPKSVILKYKDGLVVA